MTELSEAALAYLGQGLHLLALSGKRPNPRYHSKGEDDEVGWSWDKSIHGEPETAEDVRGLIEVFDHPSTTGIAILIPEHVLVADVDTEEAAALLEELAPGPIETVAAETTKGYHLWYAADGADRSVWLGGRTLLFKGFGGYVAVPPSRHFNEKHEQDGVYTWITPLGEPMRSLPAGIEEAISITRALTGGETVYQRDEPRYTVVTLKEGGGFTLHKEWNLEGLRQAIIKAPDGNQNNMIAWAAMTARDEGVPLAVAMKELMSAAIEGKHPAQRARTAIRGAYSRSRRG
jgi:hypothetical protein